MRTLILALALVGCGKSSNEVEAPATVEPGLTAVMHTEGSASSEPSPAAAPAVEAPPAPDGTDAIRALLGARHDDDLPGREVLDHHEGVVAALQWLARYDAMPAWRARAADRLGLYPEAEAFLVTLVADADQPELTRTGALSGLARLGLEEHPDALAATLEQLRGSPRMAMEAALRLEGVTAAEEGLKAAAVDPEVPEAVRARLAEAP